jgi:isovaleryl-CoA dehydrogenase
MIKIFKRTILTNKRFTRNIHYNETQRALNNLLFDFAKEEIDKQAIYHDKEEKFNKDIFNELSNLGIHGITIPEKYGGSGLGLYESCIVHQRLSYSDPGLCLAYLANSILYGNNLATNGNELQKEEILPNLCNGKIIGGMGMSETSGGTDILNMKTNISIKKNEKRMNGSKMWITNGPIANKFLVYTQNENNKLTLVNIDENMKGFSRGEKIQGKLGMRASSTSELYFDDILISEDMIIGENGNAIKCMMKNLEIERVCLAAMSLGIAERCLDIMVEYSKERSAFGKKINAFGQIQKLIADSYCYYNAGLEYVYNTAYFIDNNNDTNTRIKSDGVKLYCGNMAKQIADNAIQVLGGNGYISEYNVERLWRDSRLIEIGGGTNESHQKNIVKDLII